MQGKRVDHHLIREHVPIVKNPFVDVEERIDSLLLVHPELSAGEVKAYVKELTEKVNRCIEKLKKLAAINN